MKIIKKILIAFGASFLVIIALAIFLANSQSEFREKHEKFVKEFSINFSQSWDVASVSENLTNETLSQVNSSNGIRAINLFKSYGKITDITDFKIGSFGSHTNGISTAVFSFKAKFENAKGLVTVIVQEQDDTVRIHGFNINVIGDVSQSIKIEA